MTSEPQAQPVKGDKGHPFVTDEVAKKIARLEAIEVEFDALAADARRIAQRRPQLVEEQKRLRAELRSTLGPLIGVRRGRAKKGQRPGA